MAGLSQNTESNTNQAIQEQRKEQLRQATESHKEEVKTISNEYDHLVQTRGTGFQERVHDRAEAIQSALNSIKSEGLTTEESLESLREFGIVSSILVTFLQGKEGEEQLELIKRIISPKEIDFKACVFGSDALRQIDGLREELDNHESDAKNAQDSLVGKFKPCNGKIPSYLGFMNQISPGLSREIRSQEEKYQISGDNRGSNLAGMLEDAQSRFNQNKQDIYESADQARKSEYRNSIHRQTIARHKHGITGSSYQHVKIAREALGIPLVPDQGNKPVSGYIPSRGEFQSVFMDTLFKDRSPGVSGLEHHLQTYYLIYGKTDSGDRVQSQGSTMQNARSGLALLANDLERYYGCPNARTELIKDAKAKGIIHSEQDLRQIPLAQPAALSNPVPPLKPGSGTPQYTSPDYSNDYDPVAALKTQPQQGAVARKVESWENSLRKYCEKNNMDFENLSTEDINTASEVLLKKGFSRNGLETLLASTDSNSSLAQILNKTITHQVLDETRKQFETFIANGGTSEGALAFFLKNEKSRHLDSMLSLAAEKGEDNMFSKFLDLAQSTRRNYSNVA
jgi:hypothetical protein